MARSDHVDQSDERDFFALVTQDLGAAVRERAAERPTDQHVRAVRLNLTQPRQVLRDPLLDGALDAVETDHRLIVGKPLEQCLVRRRVTARGVKQQSGHRISRGGVVRLLTARHQAQVADEAVGVGRGVEELADVVRHLLDRLRIENVLDIDVATGALVELVGQLLCDVLFEHGQLVEDAPGRLARDDRVHAERQALCGISRRNVGTRRLCDGLLAGEVRRRGRDLSGLGRRGGLHPLIELFSLIDLRPLIELFSLIELVEITPLIGGLPLIELVEIILRELLVDV
ncbi:Uncharacterised protein [Mycobacteroides abscessus subsp. abscessus]|nr:Uncharacterised protein [Mycobacteroides abscessus subsp. abscessus]